MAIYYIESENNLFLSEDGKQKFMRLRGGEEEYVEVSSVYGRRYRQDERRCSMCRTASRNLA